MQHESCRDQSSPSSADHLVNIKDYSQHEQSDREEEDSPFDELENILAQDDNRTSRNQYLLAERVKELEKENAALRDRNARAGRKIQDLSKDLEGLDSLTREDKEAEGVLDALEKQLAEFRQGFEDYRTRQGKISLEKDTEITRLRQEVERVTAEKGNLQDERNALTDANDQLVRSNEGLILEIEQLQSDLAQSRSEIHSSRSHRLSPGHRRDHGFQSQVQAELQILIEKLMSELELQRGQKRRLNEEMKRMQKETILLEREITAKNNKIYQLEMNYLKGNRTQKTGTAGGQGQAAQIRGSQDRTLKYNEERPSKYGKPARNEATSKSDRSQTSPRTLTLMELLNSEELQDRQRLVLSSKLIDFYSRKITAKDFACYQLQSLLVCNFSKSNPNLLSVRRNTAAALPAESSQEKMLCNLGEILDVLLGEYLNEVKQEDSGEEYLLSLIGEIVNDKAGNLNDIYVIKQLIEDCLRNRK